MGCQTGSLYFALLRSKIDAYEHSYAPAVVSFSAPIFIYE
jgi:hypothetical protein